MCWTERRRGRRRLAVALVLAAAAVLAGCGDDDSPDASSATSVPVTDADTDTDTDTDQDLPSRSSGGEKEPEDPTSTLHEILITLDDLGEGWAPNTAQGDGDTSACDGRDPIGDANPLEEAESDFQHGETGPAVGSRAWRFASSEEAAEFFGAYVDALEACDGFTDSDEYEDITYHIEPIEFGAVGGRSHAVRLSASASFGEIALDVVVFQVDDTVVEVVNGGFALAGSPLAPPSEFTEVDSALTRSLVETVASRM